MTNTASTEPGATADKYATSEQREAYATRLFNRTWEIVMRDVSPEVTSQRRHWRSFDPMADDVMAVWDRWIAGEASKTEIDTSAQNVVQFWRELDKKKR